MTTGARARPIGWEARTSGTEVYTADLRPPNCLTTAVLRSPYPHATITGVDVSRALVMPGVHAIITSDDFGPDVTYLHRGEAWADRPPLARGLVRCIGQEVAAVAAETREQAEAAAQAIVVEYRRRHPILSVRQSLRTRRRLHERPSGTNVADSWSDSWGDVHRALEHSRLSTSGTYVYPSLTHAAMEPNTTLAIWHDEEQKLELWTSTQAPFFVVKEVCHVLGLEKHQVVCREIAVGGGFGSKSKISEHEVLAAALARKSRRPVLIAFTRQDEFSFTKPRHRFETTATVHLDDESRLRAIEAEILVDNGAYNHMGPSVMRAGVLALPAVYGVDAVRFDARLVDTNMQPGGQFRGYGQPQTTFAVESEIDEAAKAARIDPIDFRIRNSLESGAETLSGARYTSAKLRECLELARTAIDWDAKRAARTPDRGLGVAVAMHGSGAYSFPDSNRADAALDIDGDGRVRFRFGGADAGTGQRTILAQIVAEGLGLDVDDVEVVSIDSELTPFDMGAWSSRGTHMSGSAAAKVVEIAATRLLEIAADLFGVVDGKLVGGAVVGARGRVALSELVGRAPEAVNGVLTFVESFVDKSVEMFDGTSNTANLFPTYSFTAHAVEVEVDRLTGRVRVLDYVAVTDCGRVLNPTLAEGQVAGGIAMGLGGALGEELIRQDGRVVNPAYINYALPRAEDVPPIRALFIDHADPAGPHGAKSVGELPVIPVAPAIANAVADAVGVRIRQLPITADKVITALAESEGRRRRHHIWRRPGRWWIALLRALYPLGLHHLLHRFGTLVSFTPKPGAITAMERPTAIDEATSLLADGGTAYGGGTDILVRQQQSLLDGDQVLVSTRDIAELRRTTRDPNGDLRIGGAVTLSELSDELRHDLPAMAEAIDSIASPQTRNAATVAGNLLQEKRCWFYRNGFPCYKRNGVTSPCYAVTGDHRFYHAAIDGHRCQAVTPSDLGTALVALDATVGVSSSQGARSFPIEHLYTGPGETALRETDLLTSVHLPAASLRKSFAFKKLGLWQGDFATVSAGISVDVIDGLWRDVRIVLGAIGPTPLRARAVERELEGVRPTAELVFELVSREVDRRAHPLRGNGWKLDAISGLCQEAAQDIIAGGAQSL